MSKKNLDSDTYAGPSQTIEVLGRGNAYGWIGSGVGLAVGALIGVISSTHAEQVTNWFKRNFSLNKTTGKTAIVVGSALMGSQIGHWITYAVGLSHGKKMAGKGQEQFERVKAQRDQARGELTAVKEERDMLRQEYAEHLKSTHQHHADAPLTSVQADGLQAEKEATSVSLER